MIKSFDEMLKVDVSPYLKTREAKDDKGRKVDVSYLPWAECVKLLHENGAKDVYFVPLTNEKGSSLFMSDKVFEDKYGTTNSCYEVAVKIIIDDDEFVSREPLMNGANPVKDNSLNQHRVGNAQKRAFVKGVAFKTGLGFNLWLGTNNTEPESDNDDDLSRHSLKAIKERIQEEITELLKKDYSAREIANYCGFGDEEEMRVVFSYFKSIRNYEDNLKKMLNDKR